MKISELITELQEIQSEHGDLEVKIRIHFFEYFDSERNTSRSASFSLNCGMEWIQNNNEHVAIIEGDAE